jgi:hypothetical protein
VTNSIKNERKKLKRTTKKNLVIRTIALLSIGAVGACAPSKPPTDYRDATAQWYAYGGRSERNAFAQGYAFGQSDTVKQTYWAQNTPPANASGRYDWMGASDNETPAEPRLRRKLVNVPVPAHTEPDGTIVEARTITVETVQ